MPTVGVYLPERLYWKVSMLASKEDIPIGKCVQLIVESYFKVLEEGEIRYDSKAVQNSGGIVSD